MSTTDTDQIVQWIEAIHRDAANMTAWETDFISDMQAKIEMYGDRALFTPKQAEQIERIYSARVP